MIIRFSLSFLFILLFIFSFYFFLKSEPSLGVLQDETGYQSVDSLNQLFTVYPRTVKEIKLRTQESLKNFKNSILMLVDLPQDKLSKDSMIRQFDQSASFFMTNLSLCHTVQLTNPDEEMRKAATESITEIQALWIDLVSSNVALYNQFKTYSIGNALQENLTPEETLFLKELIEGFERDGLNLSEDKRNELKKLSKELCDATNIFSLNIAQDTTMLEVSNEELQGISQDFKDGLKKTASGNYLLSIDYPTGEMILNRCENVKTRKSFYQAKNNKAYPSNEDLLIKIISLRDKMALLMGFESHTQYDLDDTMAKDSNVVWAMLDELLPKALKKEKFEYEALIADLPDSVVLTADKKIYPWDFSFLSNYYKKKYYQVDELAIAEYFPLEQTIQGLFDVYSKFFNISFEHLKHVQAWHEDVTLVIVKSADSLQILGYVFLDLYPRNNKFQHAAKFGGILARKDVQGKIYPSVSSLVCNFTKPTKDKPSLLKYQEVSTFFHEFGHALHSIFGATDLALQSGTQVKPDFVELPSQILEYWLEDKDILKMISGHYITKEPLSDELIESKLNELKFSTGFFYARQIGLSMISLALFEKGEQKDPAALIKKYTEQVDQFIQFDVQNHYYCSWGHLTGYAAKYYGYLWSRIRAADIFESIEKQNGLLNPVVGRKYAKDLLQPGGSLNPNGMIEKYLGRAPQQDAFLRKLGLN